MILQITLTFDLDLKLKVIDQGPFYKRPHVFMIDSF